MAYEDWTAYKKPGEPVLKLLIELSNGYQGTEADMAHELQEHLIHADNDEYASSKAHEDLSSMIDFRVDVTLMPQGTFARYTRLRQAEDADLARLKPPHINLPEKVL